jgi:hypothetical protein
MRPHFIIIQNKRRRSGLQAGTAAAMAATMAAVMALASCGEKPSGPSAGSDAAVAAAPASASPTAAAAAAAAAPALPSVASTAVPAPPSAAPGLDRKKFIAPLQDAYERIDPLKDGWETEAFNTEAMKQLHLLEELMMASEPVTASGLASVVDPAMTASALRPATAGVVFDDGRLKVMRAPDGAAAAAVKGVDAFVADLNALKALGRTIAPHLKVTRVDRENDSVVATNVVIDIAIQAEQERRQLNGVWVCLWRTAADQAPVLTSVTVSQYEEVVRVGAEPLFSDATAALMAGAASYRDQLLVSTDAWRARLPRDLGLDPVANHGLAVGDVNGDELDDLYVCQQGGLPNRLFIQQADGSLRDATAESGTGWLDYCAAALLIDFDNDGDRDLVISQDFRVLVMSNDGAGRFTLEFGSSTKAQSFSLAAADYDRDGRVDFYVCGYNPSNAELRGGAMGEPMPFHDANNGGRNILWRNEGEFNFRDVTAAVGLEQNNTRHTFAAAWEDYDNDGDQDLYVVNDYGRNCLYRNENGSFTDVAATLGVEDTSSGMSVSWSDFNHDGWMDIYTSNMFSSAGNRITYQPQFKAGLPEEVRARFQHIALGNTLFQAVPGGPFKDVSIPAGVTLGRWAWCSKFVDFNNDGLDDLLVANGFITTEDSGDL